MSQVCQSERDNKIILTMRLRTSDNLSNDAVVEIKATNISNVAIVKGISILTNITEVPVIPFKNSIKPGSSVSTRITFSPFLENISYDLEEIAFFAIDNETQELMSKISKEDLKNRFKDKLSRAKEYLYIKLGIERMSDLCTQGSELDVAHPPLFVPEINGKYEFNIARALMELSFDVSLAICPEHTPRPFDFPRDINQTEIIVSDSHSRDILLGYMFSNATTGYAAIVFSSTMRVAQLRTDADSDLKAPVELTGYQNGTLVHSGFYNLYMLARHELWNWWSINQENINTLYITGHGRGGAISTLCAYDFADVFKSRNNANNSREGSDKISHDKLKQLPIHYTFGSPKCGNEKFVDEFEKRVPNSIRIFNEKDRVTRLPIDSEYEHTKGGFEILNIPDGDYIYNHITAYRYSLPWGNDVFE